MLVFGLFMRKIDTHILVCSGGKGKVWYLEIYFFNFNYLV